MTEISIPDNAQWFVSIEDPSCFTRGPIIYPFDPNTKLPYSKLDDLLTVARAERTRQPSMVISVGWQVPIDELD